jgi:hypothetical protein
MPDEDYGDEPPPDFSPIPTPPPPAFTPPTPVTTEEPPTFVTEPGEPEDPTGKNNSPTNPSSPNFDAAGALKAFNSGDPGFMSLLTNLAKMLGFTGNLKDLLPMLPFLLSTTGTINTVESKKEAAAKIEAAANKNNDFDMAEIGNAKGGFTKYNNAGNEAVDQIMWHLNNDPKLSDKFGPVVAPDTKKISGAMSLNDLAKVK